MATQLKWGIMTTGWIARKFVIDLKRSRTGRLVAVGARKREDAEKFAAEFGAERAHGGYDALLADKNVDAVYIGTLHPQHLEWAVKAAEAGKHILCEKPLALNRADSERIIAAVKRHKVFLMEAFMYRCHPQTAKLVELVRSGAIGEVRLIKAAFNVARPFDPEHRIFKRELGGGAILDLGCYPISFSRLIAGAAQGKPFAEPVEFKATGRLHPVARSDEYAAASVKYPGDIIAELSCCSMTVHDISASIHGSQGRIEIPTPFFPGLDGRDESFRLYRAGTETPEEFKFSGSVPLYAHEADTVAAAIAAGQLESPAMTHADTIANMALLDQWRAAVGMKYDGE
ncbi:MAG TPA: Gfo/Idh/MocA family oxidoreductase [Candidatus Didemnitutus sp.]|nr:Gfo/Idh/MocA family oxidoreductase [Candidatus Didemnitutus sp.]